MKTPEILIVNDELVQRHRLASLLRRAGYVIHEADDGILALEKIEKGLNPSLVITDLYMPRLDGWEFCRELRERGLKSPILVVSAFFRAEEIKGLLRALGIDDFLSSPVKRETLLAKVKDLLEGRADFQGKEIPLLFMSPNDFAAQDLVKYLEKTGFKVDIVQDLDSASELLRIKSYHVALITSDFSPDDILSLRRMSSQTSFLVMFHGPNRFRSFQYILKGAKQVFSWQEEPEFVSYLCQKEIQERALSLGQKLLRKRTKELAQLSLELERVRQLLHLVVEEDETGIVVTDQKLNPLFLNPSARKILSNFEGDNFQEFLASFLIPDPQTELFRLLKERGHYSCEIQVAGGEILNLTVKPLHEETQLSRMVFFLQDITQEREWQKRLAQVQKMEALATLTAGIAHDFNNLLGAIRLKAELLLSKLERGYRNYVADIITICDRAARVVSQIMAVNKPVCHEEVANLNAQIKETLGFLQETIPKGIRLQYYIPADPLWVCLNAGQLSQIIMNLCLNAIQAMHGEGLLVIQSGRNLYRRFRPKGFLVGAVEELEGLYAWIQVADTGSGISPDILPRIFDPYFTTKERMGTGLGLAMTANIVKNAGGLIAVETTVGKGTTFTIYLPIKEQISIEEVLPSAERPFSDHVAKILVVEDEDMILEAVQEYLEIRGYNVTSCRDGQEAVALVESGYRPDVVVLDLNMPKLSGVEVMRHIRKYQPLVPIIIVTGRVEPDKACVLKDLKAFRVLIKPFSLDDLYATLCQALGKALGESVLV